MAQDLRIVIPINRIDPNDGVKSYIFFCPGCRSGHVFETPKWEFNQDFFKPTIRASYLVYENEDYRKRSNDRHGHRCHSYVTDGKIEFLSDCTHALAGKTVELDPIHKFDSDEIY